MCDTIDIELSEEQREAYDQLKSTLRLEVQDKLSGEENTVTMNNVLTMLLRLAHVTSGFLTFDEVYDLDTGEKLRDKRIDRYDPNPKLEELVSLVKNSRPNQKIIIWCCWVQSVKTIAARLEAEGIHGVTFFGGTSDPMRDVAEQRFNSESASDCKFLCGNPACGGVGMTFLGQSDDDTDCDWIIEYDYDWSWRKRKQGRGRNRRIGTRVPTRVTTLVTEDSIDEDIYMVLQRKQDTALNLQDMKEIMQKVLEL
jgi:SNF2 family DNA or RNA helicase